MRPAALMRGRETKCDVKAGELLGGRIERSRRKERSQSRASRMAQLPQSHGGDDAILAF